MARAHVLVSGKVQGVFYRDSTKKAAEERRVNGWVRNLPNGRVEGVFEGERAGVESLVLWCRRGPALAAVTDVEVEWDEEPEGFSTFEVRPTPRSA